MFLMGMVEIVWGMIVHKVALVRFLAGGFGAAPCLQNQLYNFRACYGSHPRA